MSWKRDRDSLIAQTMAFVQSVTGRKDESGRTNTDPAPAPVELAVMEALEEQLVPKTRRPVLEPLRVAAPPPLPLRTAALPAPLSAADITRSDVQGEMANEIRA